ncbi:MAG: M14 family zinc carboxypeptidase [Lentisphaerota bacterium]
MNNLSFIEKDFGDLSEYRTRLDYWPSRPEDAESLLGSLKEARIRSIGKSAGGRDIIAIEYGQKEVCEHTAGNYMSAMDGTTVPPDPTAIFPKSFFGEARRKKPVIVLQGAIHGSEITGTVASLNLCKIIETGSDLRGKEWPSLRKLARETRICIIPWLNPDGNSRWLITNPEGKGKPVPNDLAMAMTHGAAKDGSKYRYPIHKHIFPIPPEKTAFMGAYFNDAGVNLQYDFTSPRRQPETEAWMDYYLDERPDAVLNFHCNAGSLVVSSGVTRGHLTEVSRLAGAIRSRLLKENLLPAKMGRLSWEGLDCKPVLTQNEAIFYVCGATPVLIELPIGMDIWPATCSEMLDIGLITIEESLEYAHHDGMRPYEFFEKI